MAIRLRDKQQTRRKILIPDLRSNRKKLLQGGGLVLLLLACLLHLKSAFLAQLATNSSANALYFSSELTDPNTLARLGRNEFLANGNLPKALSLYSRSLENFVLHMPTWLDLVELYNDMGEKEKAVAALRFVQDVSTDNERTSWRKAMLAHELDQKDLMAGNLLWLAAKFPNKRRQVFALADQYWTEPGELMEKFAPELYPDILEYYISINDAPRAAATWRRTTEAGTGDQKIALRYINYLLGLEQVPEAAHIWQDYYREDGSLLYNSELREPFLGSGFGWRISRAEGVSWQPADTGGGLRIQFDGTQNVSFNLTQIVPLAPGRYVLSGTIASQDLTTDQRPYWTIAGYKCDGLNVKGDMIPPSGAPDTFSLAFSVPEECSAVQILFRRSPSHYFDNKISGTITVSGLELAAGDDQGRDRTTEAEERKDPPAPATQIKTGKGNIGINRIEVY
ncbi:MAG: tetratricopeptide repeat protein [Desulfobulbaceae bacterium]